jgi:hypothetical protein
MGAKVNIKTLNYIRLNSMWEIFGIMFQVKRIKDTLLKPRYGYEQVSHNCKNIYLYCHKREGSVSYKYVGFDWTVDMFDTRRLQHLWLQFTVWQSRQFTQL